MHEELNRTIFPELMTETELVHFLRIPDVSQTANHQHVVENLKRFHQLPCIHISRKPLYPLAAVRSCELGATAQTADSRTQQSELHAAV